MNVMRLLTMIAVCLAPGACVGTTGGELFTVHAYAAGPVDASPGLPFANSLGYSVELTEARIFVGGMYLNRSRPASVSSDTSCSLAGIYVAEVLGGREVDLLSPTPQAFPGEGFATSERALSGEVWLSQGDVNRPASSAVVLRVSGNAERDGRSFPFRGKLTIGQNRVTPPTDAALPGQHPICKQRIVSPIPVELEPADGQALLLRIDPRAMFGNVDFETLSQVGDSYTFADSAGVDQASDNLYSGLRRASGVYTFTWLEKK